jgi:hypothetical protein
MTSESIDVGDIVQVNRDTAGENICMRAEVLNRPHGDGDCWEFKDLKLGRIWATTECLTVYLLEKGP